MGRPKGPLGRLGEELARGQDAALAASEAADLAAARDRLLAPASGRGRLLRWAAPFAAAAAIAAALLLVPRAPGSLSVRVAGSDRAIGEGTFVSVPVGESTDLRFSDGTRLTLAPETHARVVDLDHRGARVVLERGSVDARVRHLPRARWTVGVGPFDVRVTGTAFVVAWRPEAQEFSLALREGSVELSGPLVGRARRIGAGETCRVAVREGRFEIFSGERVAAVESRGLPEAAPVPPAPPAPRTLEAPAPPIPAWQAHAKAARWRETMEAASAGWTGLLASRDAPDLVLLGDAARYTGDVPRATEAFEAIRRRFPGTSRAADAAYRLGVMARDRAAAARWFQTYLDERPNGGLAREALGRLMEVGDAATRIRSARTYLARYPSGPLSGLARSIVEE
jgi:hypothetical protein